MVMVIVVIPVMVITAIVPPVMVVRPKSLMVRIIKQDAIVRKCGEMVSGVG